MDDRIKTVLDAYHARIEDEEKERAESPPIDGQPPIWIDRHLLAVGPETGQLINILARAFEAPNIVEIGTSYGYSAIWLAEAARATGGRLTTMELQDYKSAYAREMSIKAGLADHVDFQVGDAVQLIDALPTGIDFVLLDLWKELYVPCLEAIYPKLNAGAIIVADNMIRPEGESVRQYGRAVRAMPEMRSILLPVGAGLEISRFEPDPAYAP